MAYIPTTRQLGVEAHPGMWTGSAREDPEMVNSTARR